MPGFVLEEPFLLSRYQNTVGFAKISDQFVVGLNVVTSSGAVAQSAPDQEEAADYADHALVTVQSEGIKLYDTTMQKCLQSWTTPPGLVLGQPAVYCPALNNESPSYTYAIIDSGSDLTQQEQRKSVWMWKNASDDKSEKIVKKFDERIQSLHVPSSLHANIILVNENGSIQLITKDLDRLTANYKTQGTESVIWSTVFITTNSHIRPCCIPNSMAPANSTIVVTISKGNAFSLNLHYINEERRSIHVLAKVDLDIQDKPVSITFDSTSGIVTVLESSGAWSVYQLALKHRAANKLSATLTRQLHRQFAKEQVHHKSHGALAHMALLPGNFVALVTPRTKQKGGNASEFTLSIWDVKYGTLQAEQVIKPGDASFDQGVASCRVDVLQNSHLAITLVSLQVAKAGKKKVMSDAKSVVLLCPYFHQPMSLLSAMNKMRSTASFLGMDVDNHNDPSTIGFTRSGHSAVARPALSEHADNQTVYTEWTKQLAQSQKDEDDRIAALMNCKNKNSLVTAFMEFVGVAEDVWQRQDEPMSDAGAKLDKDRKYYKKLYNDFYVDQTKRALSSEMVSHIVNRVFSRSKDKADDTFWHPAVVVYLMAKQQLRNGFVRGGLLPALMERDAWPLVTLALRSVPDLPERDLVKTIRDLMALSKSQPDVWKDRASDYIRRIVESPRNDVFLQQAMKRISSDELPILLHCLVKWLKEPQNRNVRIQESLYDFANTLLDIHFPTIILEPSLHPLMEQISEELDAMVDQLGDMEQLYGLVAPFEREEKLHQKAKATIFEEKEDRKDAPPPDKSLARVTRFNYGGKEGIPVYRADGLAF
ncbi:hypothetical protein BC940DRAFT_242517 [Gongronella butleri]|nr:hypothetical protein BC940DRAFT_242517 [Gongronella butleri]